MNLTITKVKKPSKKEALDLIIDLKTKRRELDQADIDSLLLYFTPPLPKAAKTPLQWVAKACGTDDLREFLHYIHVKKGTAYGSDGSRLHSIKTDLEEGFYCPSTFAKVDVELKTVDFDRMLNVKESPTVLATVESLEPMTTVINGKPVAAVGDGNTFKFNEKYLSEATNDQNIGLRVFTEHNKHKKYWDSKVLGSTPLPGGEIGSFILMGMKLEGAPL